MFKKIVFTICLVLFFVACGKVVTMKHTETGHIKTCEVSGTKAAMLGAVARNYIISVCVEENEIHGYKKVGEK